MKKPAIYLAALLIFIAVITIVLFLVNFAKQDDVQNPDVRPTDAVQQPKTSEENSNDLPQTTPEENPQTQPSSETNPSTEPKSEPEIPPANNENPTNEDPTPTHENNFPGGDWSTILCNPDHALPEGYHETVKLAPVQGDYQMDYRAAPAMKAMIAAAKEDGIDLLICSTYRTTAYQKQLYENRINIVMEEDPSLSYDEAAAVAATINAVPGTSEHETGLAADIVTPEYQRLNANFDQTDAYRWLKEHCKEYGFILRYPKEKTDITKIIYEPWHYRFVGTEHSYAIMEQGLVYEEYVGTAD